MNDQKPASADWYFDFVSPFCYFQLEQFDRLPPGLSVTLKPILFAGVLNAYGHKGPAEIPAKRRFTYRFVQWRAERDGIALKMPPAHPFNPLRALRLAIVLGCEREPVRTMFRHIWAEGREVETDEGFAALARRVGGERHAGGVQDAKVKETLRRNTEEAVERGVFGVPTFAVEHELFWGVDATDMLIDYLTDPTAFHRGEMARVSDLPVGTARRARAG